MPAGSETSEKSSSELSAKGSLNSKADDEDDSNQKQNSVQLLNNFLTTFLYT